MRNKNELVMLVASVLAADNLPYGVSPPVRQSGSNETRGHKKLRKKRKTERKARKKSRGPR